MDRKNADAKRLRKNPRLARVVSPVFVTPNRREKSYVTFPILSIYSLVKVFSKLHPHF